MKNKGLIKFSDLRKELEDKSYYGLTVKRIGTHGTRHKTTFASVKWYTIDITVETLKIDGEKIVIGIEFNEEKLENYESFRKRIGAIGKEHATIRKEKIR